MENKYFANEELKNYLIEQAVFDEDILRIIDGMDHLFFEKKLSSLDVMVITSILILKAFGLIGMSMKAHKNEIIDVILCVEETKRKFDYEKRSV